MIRPSSFPTAARKNRTHLSRIRPLSRSSIPSSSRTHCDSTFFVSSSCTKIAPTSRGYALCRAAVFLPRHGRSVIRPSSSPPAARKNRTHLLRIRPLSRSSIPSSSRTHCDSTFFVSSSCTEESHPPLADTPFVAQQYSFLVTNAL